MDREQQRSWGANRLPPMKFVLAFGVVSGLGDMVYEGARSVVGPFMAGFGASAALIGLVTGLGEAMALVFRLFSGRLSDRTGRQWAISISGYAVTMVAVPMLALAGNVWAASALVIAERFGKGLRTPARDTMLAQAGTDLGRGWTFAVHEALDQAGAFIGPLAIAAFLEVSKGYRDGFAALAIPGAAALAVLAWLRSRVPTPRDYATRENSKPVNALELHGFSRRFWQYSAFSAATMAGFATFAVLAYHLDKAKVVSVPVIPIMYAGAMAMAAIASLVSGRMYDRIGLKGLGVLPFIGAAVPFFAFAGSAAFVWVGALLWGLAMGVHESTMRAAVGDLVTPARRGAGYGTFTAVYGLAWLAGATLIGLFYDIAVHWAIVFTVAMQALALLLFLPLLSRRQSRPPMAKG